MASFSVRVLTNITKEYPEMFKVIVLKQPQYYVKSDAVKRNREIVDDETYTPKVSSLNRTKSLVKDIVLCNDFELFCTFTFDPAKVDSFNFYKCKYKMTVWLHHQSDRSRERGNIFLYLIIPERHKSGRWHFHALISGYVGSLKDSGKVTNTGRPIYNITSYRNGFTTAVELDDREGVSNYITKYITKDFIKSFNQRRFFCSRGLIRPIRTTNSDVLSRFSPLFRNKVAESYSSETFELLKNLDF